MALVTELSARPDAPRSAAGDGIIVQLTDAFQRNERARWTAHSSLLRAAALLGDKNAPVME